MEKRLFALLLALSMLMTCAMPGFAAESISDSDVSGSDTSDSDVATITDEDIEAVFNAHKAEKEALAGSDLSKAIEAYEGFDNVADIINEFEDEHMAKLADMIGCNIDEVYGEITSVHDYAGNIIDTAKEVDRWINEFTSQPEEYTARRFVNCYVKLVEDSDDDIEQVIRRFFPDLDDIYKDAKNLQYEMIFELYENMLNALESRDLDVLKDAIEKRNALSITIMGFSDEDYTELGKMMGVDGDSAYSRLFDTLKTGGVIIDMGERYNEYVENSFDRNAASAFVVYYDYIFDDTSNGNVELRKLVRAFFPDIDSQYAKACTVSVGGSFVRLSGRNRTDTSVAISKEGYVSSVHVVLASGQNYADALAGVPLAYAYNAPVLLVSNNSADKAVYDEIERLGADDIFILGGEVAVSADVQERLESMGCTVHRVSGKTRYETAVEIAIEVISNNAECEEVFFVCAENYPDALSVSNVAALNGAPILFISKSGEINSAVAEFIRERGVKRTTIIGGTGAIGAAAEENIKACGVENVERVYGKDRYDTCIKIVTKYDELLCGKAINIATGENFPDALAGGAFAASEKSPLLLVNNKNLSKAQTEYIKKKVSTRSWEIGYIFGGTGVVSEEIIDKIYIIISKSTPLM